ncbi:MAG: anti-sigma F factor [Oscillospiraceae bacterium]|nr:anti-sigma F factor [Oscillospiraceae bacterium]
MKNKLINEIKLSFPSRSSNEAFARITIASFLAQADPTIDELSDVKTAVSEAVTNAIVHAYRDKIGTIYIHARLYEGGRFSIKIRDNGCGIPDIKKAREPMFTTAPDEERAGLGFAVMEMFMDKVLVRSKKDSGTTVTLEKVILSKNNNDE